MAASSHDHEISGWQDINSQISFPTGAAHAGFFWGGARQSTQVKK
jgi:hypothetical protein